MKRREHRIRVKWQSTGNAYFPWIANVGDVWWVMRVNGFPDHPLYTVFVDGQRAFDVDDLPRRWSQDDRVGTRVADEDVDAALGPIQEFLAYGSEVGRPCDNPFCCG